MGRGRARIGWMMVLAVLVLVACRGGGSAPDTQLARIDLHDGFAAVGVPVSKRQDPMMVASGERVVVYGGFQIAGTREISLGDGKVLDITKSRWRRMSAAPFDRPLWHPAGVWTGADVVVLGTPCGPTAITAIYEEECRPGGVQAAVYSPASNSWSRIPAPSIDRDGTPPSFPLMVVGLGWSPERGALFSYETRNGDMVTAYDPTAKRWRDLGPRVPVANPAVESVRGGPRRGLDVTLAADDYVVRWKSGFSNPAGGTLSIGRPGVTRAPTFAAPWSQTVALDPLDALILVEPTDQREFQRVTVGLLVPARYAAAHPSGSEGTSK
jgi:hypothetical protein